MNINLPDLTKLDAEDLVVHRNRLWEAIRKIDEETERRSALKFLWPQEMSMISMFRKAASYTPPKTWEKPASPLHAYVMDDVVEFDGKRYQVVGPGAVMFAPNEHDPTRPRCWMLVEDVNNV